MSTANIPESKAQAGHVARRAAKKPSKAITKVNGKAKATKKAKAEGAPSASRQLVQLAVRNLDADADAFVTKAKAKGIKADEARMRAVFARVRFIVGEFKAAP